MRSQEDQIRYHADVNSACLSWTTVYRICILREDLDLRDIPSVIGGGEAERYGIVLAESDSAKRHGIRTRETLAEARCKCPELVIVSSGCNLYVDCLEVLVELPRKYFPHAHQYNTDEVFCRVGGTKGSWGIYTTFAHQLKEEIRRGLSFTVNIGVSDCKLLVKMTFGFQKPDQVHTLPTQEIKRRMWPLPVSDLFWVGPATVRKLGALGIRAIGELTVMDLELLKRHLRKREELIWDYVNGGDMSLLLRELPKSKGYGNSMTAPLDVTDQEAVWQVILPLTETVRARLRVGRMEAACVGISITNREFRHDSVQTTLISAMDITLEIYEAARNLFDRLRNYSPIRRVGVYTNKVSPKDHYQCQFFDRGLHNKYSRLDVTVDEIGK